MNTENIAHYFYGSAPAEDELMNAVFSGENTVDALKTAANQHEFLYTEKIRLWNELHMALVGCPGTEPISHEPLSQAIVGVDFVDDGQVAYTLLEDLDDIVSALNEVDEDAFLDKYLQQNGVENRDAALAEFRTLRDFYNKCQDFHGDDDYILVVGKLMKTIIDHYGEAVPTRTYDEEHFTTNIEVDPSGTFYGWVFKFMGGIQIIAPQECVEEMKRIAHRFL